MWRRQSIDICKECICFMLMVRELHSHILWVLQEQDTESIMESMQWKNQA